MISTSELARNGDRRQLVGQLIPRRSQRLFQPIKAREEGTRERRFEPVGRVLAKRANNLWGSFPEHGDPPLRDSGLLLY